MSKILIAEDDEFLANAYRVKLTKVGYEVKNVKNGNEALEAIASFPPDLIILDLMMPEMDGFEFLLRRKNDPKLLGIPCIVASNLGQSDDIVRAMKLGASDYMVKTELTMKDLVEKIANILNK